MIDGFFLVGFDVEQRFARKRQQFELLDVVVYRTLLFELEFQETHGVRQVWQCRRATV